MLFIRHTGFALSVDSEIKSKECELSAPAPAEAQA